jgi:hypothetical protein
MVNPMYYSSPTRTAVEIISELIDELDDSKWEAQAADSCREALRLVAESPTLSGESNASIVMLCRNKTLPDCALSAAVLLKRATESAKEQGHSDDAVRLTCAEGMMWGVAAILSILELQARQRHPSKPA